MCTNINSDDLETVNVKNSNKINVVYAAERCCCPIVVAIYVHDSKHLRFL